MRKRNERERERERERDIYIGKRRENMFTFDTVIHDGSTQLALLNRRGRHAGTRVDLKQPGAEVLRQTEVSTVQFKCILQMKYSYHLKWTLINPK